MQIYDHIDRFDRLAKSKYTMLQNTPPEQLMDLETMMRIAPIQVNQLQMYNDFRSQVKTQEIGIFKRSLDYASKLAAA